MKKGCQICALREEEQSDLWDLFYEDRIPERYNRKDIENHFKAHRVKQPKADAPLSGKESLQLAEKLPPRLRQILLLLQKNPGLSLEQISVSLYLKENKKSALKSASRDLKRLMINNLIYRIFLEDIEGEGPRPRLESPALYFLGINARAYIQKTIKRSPVKREEWLASSTDLSSWNKPYHLLLAREIPIQIISKLDLKRDGRSKIFSEWEVSFLLENWISPFSFAINDPLKTFHRIQADGVFALGFSNLEKTRSALLPFFYYLDRGIKTTDRISEMLLSHGALPRSRGIVQSFEDFSSKTIAPVICVTENPERRDAVMEKTKHSLPDATIIIASKDALKRDLDQPVFYDAGSGKKISLLKSALLVAGSSAVASHSIMKEKASRRK
jgi:hypothetical protein